MKFNENEYKNDLNERLIKEINCYKYFSGTKGKEWIGENKILVPTLFFCMLE